MKKYFIIAVAAVAAMAACSKTEVDETAVPDKKIGFEVANYATQTKANLGLTNAEDQIFSFHTLANQFPKIGTPVVFMDVDVFPWTAAGVKIESGTDATIAKWAPVEDYYWPKTGWINFYSYAGTTAPTVDNSAADKKTVGYTYSNKVIEADSNILVAEAALHYARENSALETYPVDGGENATTPTHVTTGVPTLFHHQLAKITVDVEARTTAEKESSNTIWKVQVLSVESESGNSYASTIVPINKGSLALTVNDSKEESQSYPLTKNWTRTNESATNISGWVPSSESTDKETIALSDSDVLTIDVNSTGDGTKSEILALRSVMPQLTANVAFTLVYRVQAIHMVDDDDDDTTPEVESVFLQEIRTVGVTGNGDTAKSIGDLTSTIASWQANQKITYHIIIDPVSEKVTFDPAVEDYDPIDADGVRDDININENGIVPTA